MKLAIMQPYFYPYAGYFRLLAAADCFVIYDCVQFPRRGWVHRNRVQTSVQERWLTLPLAPAPREARIDQLAFRDAASCEQWWQQTCRTLQGEMPPSDWLQQFPWASLKPQGAVVDYLVQALAYTARQLQLPVPTLRSSALKLPDSLRGEQRILAICRALQADTYINLPGGRELYEPQHFADAGVALYFLPDYCGSFESLLGRLLKEPPAAIRAEIDSNLKAADMQVSL